MPRARSLFDRPRWTTEDAREVIATLDRSGQPVSVFAAEHGLDAQRVYVWRRRLGSTGSAGGAERTTFRELMVRSAAAPSLGSADPFEIVLRSGATVRVSASFDSAGLARLLDALARAGMC